MARTCAQNGTEKDSQGGLKMDPPSKRKQGRPKMTLRKTFEGDLKKIELTWGQRSKRETFMEEKQQLHYPEWIEAIKEEGKLL